MKSFGGVFSMNVLMCGSMLDAAAFFHICTTIYHCRSLPLSCREYYDYTLT